MVLFLWILVQKLVLVALVEEQVKVQEMMELLVPETVLEIVHILLPILISTRLISYINIEYKTSLFLKPPLIILYIN